MMDNGVHNISIDKLLQTLSPSASSSYYYLRILSTIWRHIYNTKIRSHQSLPIVSQMHKKWATGRDGKIVSIRRNGR